MGNKKKIIISATIIALLIISTVVWALFTARKDDAANIQVGEIEVVLEEDWPDDVTEFGIERNQKKVWGRSTGDKKAYVRMRFVPVVEYYYVEKDDNDNITLAEWRTAPIPQENIRVKVKNASDWVLQGNYYYYKSILNPGETTSKIDIEWEVYEMPSEIARYEKIRTDVRVILEYAQTTNDAWKELFQIEDLPSGVER
jgi:hypothetical protein